MAKEKIEDIRSIRAVCLTHKEEGYNYVDWCNECRNIAGQIYKDFE